MLQYPTLDKKNIFRSDYLGEDLYNLLDKTFIIPSSYVYNIFEVTSEYIARPDLISYDAYNDTRYADVICKLNGISNPFELNEGMVIVIPSPESIMDFYSTPWKNDDLEFGALSRNDDKSNKTKQSKRQANEAIVGDKRFRIDSKAGIIIY